MRRSAWGLLWLGLAFSRVTHAQDLLTEAFSTGDASVERRAREMLVRSVVDDTLAKRTLLERARRERRLAIASAVLFPVGAGLVAGGLSQVTIDLCGAIDFDGIPEDCESTGSSTDALVAGLAIPGTILVAASWGAEIGAATAGLRVSRQLELLGLPALRGHAIAGIALASVPLFGANGLLGPYISLAHANRVRAMLDDRAGIRRRDAPRLRLSGDVAIGASHAVFELRGTF